LKKIGQYIQNKHLSNKYCTFAVLKIEMRGMDQIQFKDLKISNQLLNSLDELGFSTPTPVQANAFPIIMSGKDIVGISQTGTGKTLAYMLPILQGLKFSNQINPRVLILVPTRELVVQLVERIEEFTRYMTVRVLGVYGGTNINTQKMAVAQGVDILVATPGRLYDLAISRALQLKSIMKLVIDEVDVMLDLGFRFQLTNIFELIPSKRQSIMFSATMTEEVDALIDDLFVAPEKISIAVSGTPLDNIEQSCYRVPNFFTKINILEHLVSNKDEYRKVLVFTANKRHADRIYSALEPVFASQVGVIHSNKSQNYRLNTIDDFDSDKIRVLVTTDIMARGLDLEKISHVINFDTPVYPENYMHRIGRTGRAEKEGKSILLYTEKELEAKQAIESLMNYEIPEIDFPEGVEISKELIPEERPKEKEINTGKRIIQEPRKKDQQKKDKKKKGNSPMKGAVNKYYKKKSKSARKKNRKG